MTTQFARVCDIWQVLEEEVLSAGGHAQMLERLAKSDLRSAIRNLAEALVRSAEPRRAPVAKQAVVLFDPEQAKQIWRSAEVWSNPNISYHTFTWRNTENQTRLHLGISHWPHSDVQVELDLVTLDCPQLGQSRDKPHQRLMHLALRSGVVRKVVYDSERRSVDFLLDTTSPHRHLCIRDEGGLVFTDW